MTPIAFKELRLALGLTQAELGALLDITATSVGRMERGEQWIEKRTELAMLHLKSCLKLTSRKRRTQ